jgi:hypothetical protein
MEIVKVYYLPGDICEIKQDIPNKPLMVVKKKYSKTIRPNPLDLKKDFLLGIVCYWFTTTGEYQENVFSTKDLRKV